MAGNDQAGGAGGVRGQQQVWNGLGPNPGYGSIGGGLMPNVLQPLGNAKDDTDAGALIRLATEQGGAVLCGDLDSLKLTPFAILPLGKRLQSLKPLLDEYLPRPDRAAGFAVLTTLASFVEHVKRHADPRRSVTFADGDTSRLIAIYDYHSAGTTGAETGMLGEDELPDDQKVVFGAPGEPGWCGHGAIYTCPFSTAWEAWTAAADKPMTPEQFANFLEDRIEDVTPEVLADSSLAKLLDLLGGTVASPTVLIGLARNLQVNVNSSVRQALNLSSGEVDIAYIESHEAQQAGAGQAIRVPSMFAIGIAVYDGGEGYQLGVKLRYRLAQGKLTWFFQIHRVNEAADLAFDRVVVQAREAAGVPVLLGTPGKAIALPG